MGASLDGGLRSPALARGFKARAHGLARAVRAELGLPAAAKLDPFRWAEHRGILVLPLRAFAATHAAQVEHLHRDESAFSAALVTTGTRSLLVYNYAQSRPRQAANVAHELAHFLLGHPARRVFTPAGCRALERRVEAEADWLGPALLVSEEAALLIARSRWPLALAARRFGVSVPLLRFRLNVTAAQRRSALPAAVRERMTRGV